MSKAQELVAVLDQADSLGVVCHNNPDPDCLASALALQAIADQAGVESVDILFGGEISHQQNRAFVNLIDIELTPIPETDVHDYELLAFVDHSNYGQNTDVSDDVPVHIVIDHHGSTEPIGADLVDVRDEYGATATIFVEYLRELEVDLTPILASALLFALHRERIDYVRSPTVHEYDAAGYVYPAVDVQLLEQMYAAAFTPATLDAIGEAIRNREVRGSALFTSVGRTTERDAVPQAADYLLNLEGIETVLVVGIVEETAYLSARSIDLRTDVSAVLEEAFGDVGTAGGHQDMAGAQIPLGIFADRADDDESLTEFMAERIASRFFEAMKLDEDSISE